MREPTIVFVNFLCAEQIATRAERLITAGFRVLIVDNSGEYRGPGDVAARPGNVGFGAACNVAIANLGSQDSLYCLHNPDLDASPDLIRGLTDALHRHGGAGIVAPALETPTGVIKNGYGYPSLPREIMTMRPKTTAPSPLGARKQNRAIKKLREAGSKRFGSGALLVGDIDTFNAIGGFDERYVLYGEDLDLWHRIGLHGAVTEFENNLVATHARGGGSPTSRDVREVLRWTGIELFSAIHGPAQMWRAYRQIHRAGIGGRETPVHTLVGDLWDSGTDPLKVSATLKAAFADGLMKRS